MRVNTATVRFLFERLYSPDIFSFHPQIPSCIFFLIFFLILKSFLLPHLLFLILRWFLPHPFLLLWSISPADSIQEFCHSQRNLGNEIKFFGRCVELLDVFSSEDFDLCFDGVAEVDSFRESFWRDKRFFCFSRSGPFSFSWPFFCDLLIRNPFQIYWIRFHCSSGSMICSLSSCLLLFVRFLWI